MKGILPERYRDFKHHVLDIDPSVRPDICCDALEMKKHIGEGTYDAVLSSHNLEHFYAHQVPIIVAGIFHVLKPGGTFEVRVPDIVTAWKHAFEKGVGLHGTLYQSQMGPISLIDMIYGHRGQIQRSGQPFYAHKTAFTVDSLTDILLKTGFIAPNVMLTNLEIAVICQKPQEKI